MDKYKKYLACKWKSVIWNELDMLCVCLCILYFLSLNINGVCLSCVKHNQPMEETTCKQTSKQITLRFAQRKKSILWMINSKIVVALALSCCNYDHVSLTISAAFSPIMNTTAFVCAAGMSGTEKKYSFHIEMLLSRRKFQQFYLSSADSLTDWSVDNA